MKPINEQLNPKFINQARTLSKYTALLRKILPVECLDHVEVANIRNQNLMLITDSPVWTTKLRQLCPQILQTLQNQQENTSSSQQSEPKIHHIQISTRYKHSLHSNDAGIHTETKVLPAISRKTAELLSQSANSISHQPLRDALLKIASHASDKKSEDHKK